AFAAVRDLLVRHARFGPKVRGVVQTRDKAARVAAFSVPVENGSFRLQGDGAGGVDAAQQGLFDEMTTFPLGEHDDLVDAAAFGPGRRHGTSAAERGPRHRRPGRSAMAVSAIEESVCIPAGLTDHEAFRRWARSDDFPENGRISYLDGTIRLEMMVRPGIEK